MARLKVGTLDTNKRKHVVAKTQVFVARGGSVQVGSRPLAV